MTQRHDYWIHGIATILESPELAQLVQHRSDIGTVVEQNGNTSGWFHIPIPTPLVIANDISILIRRTRVHWTVNNNAKVDLVHVRRGQDLILSKSVSFQNAKSLMEMFTIPGGVYTGGGGAGGGVGGITLSVHVQFLSGTPRGRVEFHGAGAEFESSHP